MLSSIIEDASIEDLKEISGTYIGEWGPRRKVIFLLEELRLYKEYFYDTERILFKLALSENEDNIGNNATHTWKSCFDIYPAETVVPFLERFEILRKHLASDEQDEVALGFMALSRAMSQGGVRFIRHKPLLIKMPPEPCQPRTLGEIKDCYSLIVQTLKAFVTETDNAYYIEQMQRFLIDNIRTLVDYGFLNEIINIFNMVVPDDSMKLELISKINKHEQFLKPSYREKLNIWKNYLLGSDYHAQLLRFVGVSNYDTSEESEWKRGLHKIALDLISDKDILVGELPWLFSENAKNAWQFGNEIGKFDEYNLAETILNIDYIHEYYDFAKGYVAGYVYKERHDANLLISIIGDIEKMNPALAFNLYLSGDKKLDAFNNCFRLIKQSKVNTLCFSEFLRYLSWGEIDTKSLGEFILYFISFLTGDHNHYMLNIFRLFRQYGGKGVKVVELRHGNFNKPAL